MKGLAAIRTKVGVLNLLLLLAVLSCGAGPAEARSYEVGEGRTFERLSRVPWDDLLPGDVVRIHWRERPYREKIVVRRSGTKTRPIIIRGVRGPSMERPVLSGSGARHVQTMRSPRKARRGLIILGDGKPASHVIIEGLEIRNANPTERFTWGEADLHYADNAAGVFVDKGTGVTVRRCVIHGCSMGVITSYFPDVGDFTLQSSWIYDNGDFDGSGWGHNVYLCANRTWVQFNRFGELHSDGNNIKDRSGRTVIRYNWIEGGLSRQIDLVEAKAYPQADAYVYGNVIAQGERTVNPKMILFGGDVGGSRKGTLHFFNNTVHAGTGRLHAFIYMNRPDCRAIIRNNLFLGRPRIWMGNGSVSGSHNVFPFGADTRGFRAILFGGREQCTAFGPISYMPRPGSLLVDRGAADLPAAVRYMPTPVAGALKRPFDGRIDIGAFELPEMKGAGSKP
jgi:hypothetical protein